MRRSENERETETYNKVFPSLHFCVICFMERLLQINIIGIHRRVLSPDEAPCAPGLLHFFPPSPPRLPPFFVAAAAAATATATAIVTTTINSPSRSYSPTMTATTTSTSTLATSTHRARRPTLVPTPTPSRQCRLPMRDTRGSAGAHASSRFYYPRFLEFFQWRPALFHGLSLLYAYILPSEGSTTELYTLPSPPTPHPLTATLVLRRPPSRWSLATCVCTGCIESRSISS
ncbi:hypothetical protein ALC56_11614 [Trachymyrmex septentrionalis]|uniref:Uncharacterized protein n=1 Tax=Trachymyrmex septentrionalis TaxID=34720 RepID=A0A195F1Z1_9HYME|nr:hypothetical protein ALC56_11614 [Trachymyrmex septentrionalis]